MFTSTVVIMDHTHELQPMGKTPQYSEAEAQTKGERDAQVLARLGKKSVLEVGSIASNAVVAKLQLTNASVVSASSPSAVSAVQSWSPGKEV